MSGLKPGGGNEAARFHHASRRRNRLAALSARPRQQPRCRRSGSFSAGRPAMDASVSWRRPSRLNRGRLCRGPERHGRIPLGRRPIRSTAGIGCDLVGRQVAVIILEWLLRRRIAKAATSTPIVFAVGSDPVTFGLVTSLSRPDGNLTGFAST